MNFKTIQEKVFQHAKAYGEKYGIEINQEFSILKLQEEVGELAAAILIDRKYCRPEKCLSPSHSKQALAQEFSDVIGMTMLLAHLMEIDIEEALYKKWINNPDCLKIDYTD